MCGICRRVWACAGGLLGMSGRADWPRISKHVFQVYLQEQIDHVICFLTWSMSQSILQSMIRWWWNYVCAGILGMCGRVRVCAGVCGRARACVGMFWELGESSQPQLSHFIDHMKVCFHVVKKCFLSVLHCILKIINILLQTDKYCTITRFTELPIELTSNFEERPKCTFLKHEYF